MDITTFLGFLAIDAICTTVAFRNGHRGLGWVGVVGVVLPPLFVWFPLYGALSVPRRDSPRGKAWTRLVVSSAVTHAPPETPATLIVRERVKSEAASEEARDPYEELLLLPTVEPAWPPPGLGADIPTSPAPSPVDTQPSPTAPRTSGPFRERDTNQESDLRTGIRRAREAIGSEMAMHGFSYLGVLMTFVAVLGFLLFAFVTIPDSQQLYYEVAIAVVFFAWSWFLKRQNAVHVGRGMELIGGMVLPLIIFASLVDGIPFPPDFVGGPLIAALVLTTLGMALAYASHTNRRPESALRFLVAPLIWIAPLALGFLFKSDELLTSDAITRLVSAQPALAAAAIAATTAMATRRRNHRLAEPSIVAALIGAPVTYLLTVSLAVGEDWVRMWPIALIGITSMITAELLAGWFDRRDWMRPARPLLLGLSIFTIAPGMDNAWTGLAVTLSYLALFEYDYRLEPRFEVGSTLSFLGVTVGLVMSLDDPMALILSAVAVAIWAQVRRHTRWARPEIRTGFVAVAAGAPYAAALGIAQAFSTRTAAVVIGVVLVTIAAGVRIVGAEGRFWAVWLRASSLVAAAWTLDLLLDGSVTTRTAAVVLAAFCLTIAVAPMWPVGRVWLSAVVGSAALLVATSPMAADIATALWAVSGVALVIASILVSGAVAGHLALLGHLAVAVTFVVTDNPALAWSAWSTALLGSTVAEHNGKDPLVDLMSRVFRLGRSARWVLPATMTASLPPTLVALANRSDWFVDRRALTGVLLGAIGIGYAIGTRQRRLHRPWRRVLGMASTILPLLGLAAAMPEPWPVILAASAVIAVSLILSREHRTGWFEWITWVVSLALVLLIAERLGTPIHHLYQVSLGYGMLLLLGGLVGDDLFLGRRSYGEGVRTPWLRRPVAIGALTVPASLAVLLYEAPASTAWWLVACGVLYFAFAWALRAGSVTIAGYGLTVFALTRMAGDFLSVTWILLVASYLMVGISWVLELRQPEAAESSDWLRWDLPPLLAAHGTSLLALVIAPASFTITALAVAGLALGVAMWKRNRIWADCGNLLAIVASAPHGPGWLALALALTTVRGIGGTATSEGAGRLSYLSIALISAAAAWPSFLVWIEAGPVFAIETTALVFGAAALVVACGSRFRRWRQDAVRGWMGLALIGLFFAAVAGLGRPDWLTGPQLAMGIGAGSLALELGWRRLGRAARFLAPVAVGVAWIALVLGLGWSLPEGVRYTAIGYALIVLIVVEMSRRSGQQEDRTVTTAWIMLCTTAFLGASVVSLTQGVELTAIGGAGLAMTIGLGRAASPLRLDWLRDVAALTAVAAINALTMGVGASYSQLATTLVVLAAISAGTSVGLWRHNRTGPWVTPLLVFAMVVNIESGVIGLLDLPSTSLAIAVLLSVSVQAASLGITRQSAGVLAIAPPAAGLAFVLATLDSLEGTAQWYTVPLGLVLLAEVEILRWARTGTPQRNELDVKIIEWAGIGFLTIPGIVEMFTTNLIYGLVPFVTSGLILLWATVTRVRRRAMGAALLAVATSVLVLFAAAAGRAPDSAAFWIVAFGSGFTVMIAAAMTEAYRNRRGKAMVRFYELMEGWE